MPRGSHAAQSSSRRRDEIEWKRDGVRNLSGGGCIEDPDARLEAQERPVTFRVALRRERALAQVGAAGEAEQRFDAHVGILDDLAAIADNLAGETIERLCEEGRKGRKGRKGGKGGKGKNRADEQGFSDDSAPVAPACPAHPARAASPAHPVPPALPSVTLPFRDRV